MPGDGSRLLGAELTSTSAPHQSHSHAGNPNSPHFIYKILIYIKMSSGHLSRGSDRVHWLSWLYVLLHRHINMDTLNAVCLKACV